MTARATGDSDASGYGSIESDRGVVVVRVPLEKERERGRELSAERTMSMRVSVWVPIVPLGRVPPPATPWGGPVAEARAEGRRATEWTCHDVRVSDDRKTNTPQHRAE